MRNLFVLTIAIVVVIIGFAVYTEFNYRQFIEDLPQAPTEKSTRQQNPPSPKLGSQSTEQTAKELKESEIEIPDLQAKTFDTEDNTPKGSTAASLNQKAASPQEPIPDWRNDDDFLQPPSRDPWHQEDMSMKFVDWNKLSQDERLSMVHKSLLKEFGDIPQVRTVIAFDNRPTDLPISIDEAITHTEASLYLWPDEETRQCLVQLKQLKASGFKEFPGVK